MVLYVDEELLYRISSGSDYFNIAFSDTDTLKIKQSISSSVNLEFISNAVYRDPSAWMHLLVVFDTTQSTEANRVKIYVNGTQVTSWSTSTYPSQNTDMLFGAANANTIALQEHATKLKMAGAAHASACCCARRLRALTCVCTMIIGKKIQLLVWCRASHER